MLYFAIKDDIMNLKNLIIRRCNSVTINVIPLLLFKLQFKITTKEFILYLATKHKIMNLKNLIIRRCNSVTINVIPLLLFKLQFKITIKELIFNSN